MALQLLPTLLFFNQALTQFQRICAAQLFSVRGIWRKTCGTFLLDLYLICLDSGRAWVSLSSSWCAGSVGSRCIQWNLCWRDQQLHMCY